MKKLDPNKYVVITTDKDMHVLFLSGNDGHTAPAFMPLSDNVIQFRTHEDAAYASKLMWEHYHNGGTIWKVSHLYLDPYYKNPMYTGVCKKNFTERIRRCFSDIYSIPDRMLHDWSVRNTNKSSTQAYTNLPIELIQEVKDAGFECEPSGFTSDDKDPNKGYTILIVARKQTPEDYDRMIKVVTDLLVKHGFNKDLISQTKWD